MQEQNEEDHQCPQRISCNIQEGIVEEKKGSLLSHVDISSKPSPSQIPADKNKFPQLNHAFDRTDGNNVIEKRTEKIQVQKEMLQERKNKDQTNQQSKIKQKNQQIPEKSIKQLSNQNDKTSSNEQRSKSLVPRAKTVYKVQVSDSDYEESGNFRFPLTNPYFNEHMDELAYTTEPIDQRRSKFPTNTFVNCDVRYFNWELFTEQVGKFDVMIIDPPWRIKGAQKNDSQFMFSNCKFSLQYNTMSNHEIKQLPLHTISDEGFIFLWILNTQLNSSLEIMQSWGYQLVEELVWVKLRNQKIYLTHGYYFMHSYQICLVGYKNKRKDGKSMSLRGGLNPNVIFGEVRKKSQKPEDIYTLIQMMFKGKRKIEVFARNHNIRFGIFSVGNELGEAYDKWMLHLRCDKCDSSIAPGTKRFKSKIKDNFDICEICILQNKKQEFFEIANEVDEDVRHQYLSCNHCGVEPIWGIRFQCVTCHDYDLCESCFDKYLMRKSDESKELIHPIDHEFRTLEVPVFGYGFQIHASKCSSCYQNPIVGVCMNCTSCKSFKLCQKCFFQRPRTEETNFSKTHRADHEFQAIFEEQYLKEKKIECFNCKKVIIQDCWMCQNCYNFYFCGECYPKRDKFKSLYANSHKKYHVFAKAF